jgi:hypothetical protein
MPNNDKIQNFFSNQLRELKNHYKTERGGRIYTAPNMEAAVNRALEMADFEIVLGDIKTEKIVCNCGKDRIGYVIVNPQTLHFFCVSICKCK